MTDLVIRPTMKYIKLGYAAVLLILVASVIGFGMLSQDNEWRGRPWILAIPLLLFIWPAKRNTRRQFTKVTIQGSNLRYETGALGKSTRNIPLPKVQDVRVDQSVSQRLFNVGNLSIETAGEASRLTVSNIDQPQQVADQILAASHASPGLGQNV
jgi:uncharacterized membrane protein YdbT with pleckstrin-like domain